MMKKALLYLVLFLITITYGFSQSHLVSSQSVVKVKTVFTNNKGQVVNGTATGWCYYNPLYIVTALHAVAGVSKITVYKDNNFVDATIERVILKADLALLRLSTSLNLSPLSLERVDPNSELTYYVWGFPHGVYAIQGNKVDFALTRETTPTLNSILNETSKQVKIDLTNQGYPLPDVQIIRIGSTLQPGQSGAPILTSQGKVIGVADGGLYGGASLINWAMPASVYVPQLLFSTDRKPSSLPFQVNLMNTTTVDYNATNQQQRYKMENEAKANTIVNGTNSISKVYTATIDQILANLPENKAVKLRKDLIEMKVATSTTMLDVYQDFKTGIAITMPRGGMFTGDPNGWYKNSSIDGITYAVCPWNCASPEKAAALATSTYQSYIDSKIWFKDTKNQDVIEPVWGNYERYLVSANGANMMFSSHVYGSTLIMLYIIYREDQTKNLDYLNKLVLYLTASMTYSGFAK
ncbi:serine protease [Mucilaginibacter sp. HMF5004]|uniref:S1 family peptidase n=1 Tax=Mucilaginibacter rivuli TaxID=2857527 RepID=UPI001C5F2FE8|nr:serine protease [Mucilaginibacter rivuli]MBW4891580.1 serine protease [Mucilaginibacter rivuli]